VDGALASYDKASNLYHAWYDLDLEKRKELKKEYDKLEMGLKEGSEHPPSDASCHVADSALAAATFASGDLLAVETLYNERFDLDHSLALMAANVRITKGEFAQAQAPLRQSLQLRQGDRSWTRLALAMVYANAGDWTQASLLFNRSLADDASTQSAKVWLDSMQSAQGKDAALAAAQSMVKKSPESAVAQYALAYVLQDSEDESARSTARNQGEALFAKRLTTFPRTGASWSTYSRWLTLMGDTDKAEEAANKAMKYAPGKAASYIAMAEVHAANDNADGAHEYTKKAAQAEPRHPGYAQLINTVSQ
jgi:tetratricopeptide (TPR) repeat protein